MGLPEIRNGVQKRLTTIQGLKACDNLPSSIAETPLAYVLPTIGSYHYTMDDNMLLSVDVTLLVSMRRGFSAAQELLDDFISSTGDRSIRKAIEDDKTLDGACSVARVEGWRDYGFIIYGGVQYLGVRFSIEIHE